MEGDRAIKCGFCHLGTEVESICGKLHYDNKNTAAHDKCMQYSADLVQYRFASFGGFKIDKVEKEIQRGKRLKCTICRSDKTRHGKWQGATAGCAISKCSKTFHFYCAKLDDEAITKRMEKSKEKSKLVMYRVFCGIAHYEQFKNDKVALKKQHQQMNRECSDEELQSGDEEEQNFHLEPDSQNTQMDDDILMISQMSECDVDEDNNPNLNAMNESSDSELENPLKNTTPNQRTKTVDRKGDNRTVDNSKNCNSDIDSEGSDIAGDENRGVTKGVEKSSGIFKVTLGRNYANSENRVRKGKLDTPKQHKTPVSKNSGRKSKTVEQPESSTPKINVRGSTKKLGEQQVIGKDTQAPQIIENGKGKQKKNSSPGRCKQYTTERGTEEGEREDSSGESNDADYDQNLIESSDSELEDPFNSKPANIDRRRSLNRKVKNNLLNNSRDWDDHISEGSDMGEDEDRTLVKDTKKSAGKKLTVGKKSTDSESNASVKKGRFDTTKSSKTPVTKDSKVSKTTERPASSTPKKSDRGTPKKLGIQHKIITEAELHITTSPSSVEENTDDEGTSNGIYHSSDDEPTVVKTLPPSPQKAKIGSKTSTPVEEFFSESEWEETATFPDCALAITSTRQVWPSRRNMIPQKARELFDVQHVAMWSQSSSFSDQLTDDHLPHFIKIVADLVREKKFKKLGHLLTDSDRQVDQMEYIKHLLTLPDDDLNNLRKSLLAKIEDQEINGESVLVMDTKLSTLFLKLNNTVDRVYKIRNKLLPNVKESVSSLYEWKESTVSAVPLSQSDIDLEWKEIGNWLKHEGWNECEICIYPSEDIFLAPVENQGIEQLIESHHSGNLKNQKKLIFVRAMDDMVNLNRFIQSLIGSCTDRKHVLIISHVKPTITMKSLLPTNLEKGVEVKVMSAFKPSNKRGISTVVICVSNPNWQQQRSTGPVHARASDDEITVCPEDDVTRERKRKSLPVRTTDLQSKRKRTT